MCYITRHICKSCKHTHDELVSDPHAKQPEILWSEVRYSASMKIREVHEDPEGCLFCYEKEYKKLETIFESKMRNTFEEAKKERWGLREIEMLSEEYREEFEGELRELRKDFTPYGG